MDFWKRPEGFGFTIPQYTRAPHNALPCALQQDMTSEALCFENTDCVKMSGNALLKDLLAQCKQLAETRYAHHKRPRLAAILPGDDPASQIYVSHKQKKFAEAGFESELFKLSLAECTRENLEKLIVQLNADESVDGILLQLPLPNGIDATPLLDLILPSKDVDGFHVQNTGCLASGRYDGFLPCTPFGIMVLLNAYGVTLEGKNVTVVGRSNIVGKPAALLALNARATVSVVHKASKDIGTFTKQADVLIAGAGSHHLITPHHLKEGVVLVDVGIHRMPSAKLEGDIHPDSFKIASAATPVPGGVGPMTIAMLCVNTAMACWGKT